MFKIFKKIKKYLCICTISSTLCQFIIPIAVYAKAKPINNKNNKNNIEDLKKEKENHTKNQKDLEAKIALITKDINNLLGEIKRLKNENRTKQESISNISSKILNTKNEIADIDFEIQNLTRETEELNTQFLKILKFMYTENINNINSMLDYLLSINDFVEFANYMKYSKVISDLFENIMKQRNEKIKEIDKNKNIREEEIRKISPEQREIELSIEQNNEKTSQIEKLMQECMKKNDELKNLLRMNKNKTKIIEDGIRTLEKINKKFSEKPENIPIIEEINKATTNIPQTQTKKEEKVKTPAANSKGHVFPVLGNCSIFQGFRKGHPAIDIQTYGKPNPVVASKAGTVVVAARGGKGNKMSGYGNVVVIDHGNGERTLYAHLSSFKVSAGQKVNQGEVIANVGNTGSVSGRTGMHLHYERIVNGVRVNPTFGNPKPAPPAPAQTQPKTPPQQNTKNKKTLNNTGSKTPKKNNKTNQGNKKK